MNKYFIPIYQKIYLNICILDDAARGLCHHHHAYVIKLNVRGEGWDDGKWPVGYLITMMHILIGSMLGWRMGWWEMTTGLSHHHDGYGVRINVLGEGWDNGKYTEAIHISLMHIVSGWNGHGLIFSPWYVWQDVQFFKWRMGWWDINSLTHES